MKDHLQELSKPAEKVKTLLATVYTLNHRDSKKGRLWIPCYDSRFPLEFEVRFAYISRFFEQDNAAGNHYHLVKEEILIPMEGKFDIYLEDVKTKENEMLSFGSEENKAVYIKTGVSHKVVSRGKSGLLLVLASSPSALEDEIEYDVK